MVRNKHHHTPLNADHTHDSEREHQFDTLAAEVSKDLGLDVGAARAWAQAELDNLLAFAAWWDQQAEDLECQPGADGGGGCCHTPNSCHVWTWHGGGNHAHER